MKQLCSESGEIINIAEAFTTQMGNGIEKTDYPTASTSFQDKFALLNSIELKQLNSGTNYGIICANFPEGDLSIVVNLETISLMTLDQAFALKETIIKQQEGITVRLIKNNDNYTQRQEISESSTSSDETDPRQLMTISPEIPIIGKPVFVKAEEQI